jgi:hypothetical protein
MNTLQTHTATKFDDRLFLGLVMAAIVVFAVNWYAANVHEAASIARGDILVERVS